VTPAGQPSPSSPPPAALTRRRPITSTGLRLLWFSVYSLPVAPLTGRRGATTGRRRKRPSAGRICWGTSELATVVGVSASCLCRVNAEPKLTPFWNPSGSSTVSLQAASTCRSCCQLRPRDQILKRLSEQGWSVQVVPAVNAIWHRQTGCQLRLCRVLGSRQVPRFQRRRL
jgi:hypothetical protein